MRIRGYTLTYLDSVQRRAANHMEIRARVAVTENGKRIGTIMAGKNSYFAEQQTSNEVSIRELVDTIVRLVGFSGQITWDASYPDGQPRRKLDVEMARREFGFSAQVNLEEGLRRMLDWYQSARD